MSKETIRNPGSGRSSDLNRENVTLGLNQKGTVLFVVLLFLCFPLCWLPWCSKDLRVQEPDTQDPDPDPKKEKTEPSKKKKKRRSLITYLGMYVGGMIAFSLLLTIGLELAGVDTEQLTKDRNARTTVWYPSNSPQGETVSTHKKLTPEIIAKANRLKGTDLVVMSVLYRGEPFAAVCKLTDLGECVSVKPLALVLSEEQLDHVEDIKGDRPESGLRKNLIKGDDHE